MPGLDVDQLARIEDDFFARIDASNRRLPLPHHEDVLGPGVAMELIPIAGAVDVHHGLDGPITRERDIRALALQPDILGQTYGLPTLRLQLHLRGGSPDPSL